VSTQYLLDTSILVELLRGRADHLLPRLDAERTALGVSAITVMELDYGVERSTRREDIRRDVDQLLALLPVRPYDRAAAHRTAQLRHTLARQGLAIGPFDSLIAGHAISLGLTVVTQNLREFARVPGLTSEDWLAAP